MARLDFIDALRGISSLYIFMAHLILIPKLDVPGLDVITKGWMWVIPFFMISGFSILLSLEKRQDGALRFYIRRFFRIAPLFYIVIIIWLCLNSLMSMGTTTADVIILNVLFLNNFIPEQATSLVWAGWTIGVEMPFYLIAPIIFMTVNSLKRLSILLAITIVLSYVASLLAPAFIDDPSLLLNFDYMSVINQLPVFVFGMGCYFIHRDIVPTIRHRKMLAAILFLIFLIFIYFIYWGDVPFLPNCIKAIAFGALILAFSLNPISLLVNRVTIFFGTISYSTYLIHPIIIYLLIPTYYKIYSIISIKNIAFLICLLMTLAILTSIATLSYRLIETQGTNLGRTIINRFSLQ